MWTFFHKRDYNVAVTLLRSTTKGSSKGKSIHTRVRIEVHHEVHVRTEVSRVHSKEEVHVPAVEKKDIQERGEFLKTVKEQKQMIIDLQLRINPVEDKLKPGPSDVDHLDKPYKNWNDVLDNFHADSLDHKSVEGVNQCIGLNDEDESVAVDGLISLRSRISSILLKSKSMTMKKLVISIIVYPYNSLEK
nr:hypothetical protein [Tanacetum cinerariifolium]